MADSEKREKVFSFTHLPDKKCLTLANKDTEDLLTKWCMKGRINVNCYSYDKQFQSYQKNDFVLDFLTDSQVMSTLPMMSSKSSWGLMGFKAAKVEAEPVACTITSMAIFDRLEEEGIVRESGSIMKCFDDFYEDFQISDELRKMLLLEDSDNYEMYSDDERDELLLCIFKHLCLGGAVCQYEDDIKPYLDTTKALYKELVSVQKDGSTQELRVTSLVYKVKAWDQENYQFYPSEEDHDQTFAYLIVDPLKRHVKVLYHRWGSGIFG